MGNQKYIPNEWNRAQWEENGRIIDGYIMPKHTRRGIVYMKRRIDPRHARSVTPRDLSRINERISTLEHERYHLELNNSKSPSSEAEYANVSRIESINREIRRLKEAKISTQD